MNAKWSANDVAKVLVAAALLLVAGSIFVALVRFQPQAHAAPVQGAVSGDHQYHIAFDARANAMLALSWKPSTGESTLYRYRYMEVGKPAEWVADGAQLAKPATR